MRRLLACVAILAVTTVPLRAQKPETVIRLTVDAMPAPKPALRYLLLPELKEMHPGNPIPVYLKSLMEQDFSADQESLRPSALRLADWAARLDTPDWQILDKLKSDGFSLLVPDVQKMRTLANPLQARFRREVSQRDFAAALRTAKTMFALSRHVSEHPTLVGGLVAAAIATVTMEPLEEMLQQPGCPNLYWALTNLPHPMVSLRRGWEAERLMVRGGLHELTDSRPMTADEIEKTIRHLDLLRDRATEKTQTFLDALARKPGTVPAARRRLIDNGLPADRVAHFPGLQVLLLDQERLFEIRRDDLMKLMNLPEWQVDAQAEKIKRPKEPGLFDFLTPPALLRVRHAQGRLEQRLALVRHVEALRLHAAEHDGHLPAKLADIDVPLPDDPFTGKPFRYRLAGATAHLYGTPPPKLKDDPFYNLHYEVTIRK